MSILHTVQVVSENTSVQSTVQEKKSLREMVITTITKYYRQVDLYETTGIYELVLAEIEEPLLETTMRFVRGNQSRAAIILGISRGNLRKKLKQYCIDYVKPKISVRKPMLSLENPIEPIQHQQKPLSLRETVIDTVTKYYRQVDLHDTSGVYNLVLAEIEEPLLETTLRFTRSNQSHTAIIMGLSRGTLRKKLKQYGLD